MKKKYVFSFINWFDNELTLKIIESDLSAIEVAIEQLCEFGWKPEEEDRKSLKHLKQFAFDCDAMFEIIEV